MIKKMLYILLVICMIGTICAPTAFGSEIQITSHREPVKFAAAEYYAASNPDQVYDTLASFNAGQWLEYKVKIQNSGTYYIGTYSSHAGSTAIFSVSVDGENIGSGDIIPNGAWGDFSTLTKLATCELSGGVHTIRIENEKGGIHVGYFEVGGVTESTNRTDFSRKNGAYKEAYLPTIINAEDYDIGSEGGLSNDGENSGRMYRNDGPLDVFKKTESDGDYYLRLNNFEYVNYSFNVMDDGVYTMTLKTKGNGKLSVYLDDMPYPLVYNVSGRAEYSRTTPVNILLKKGAHRIRIECDYSMVYLENIAFTMAVNEDAYFTEEDFMSEIGEILNENAGTGEPDYDDLDAPNEVYKSIYVAPNGNDEADGSKSAPFASMERALSEVAASTASMTGDIIVSFAPGVYTIDKTQMLSTEHGGKNGYNVIFRGADANNKPVFSGGQKVTGWKKHNDFLWRAPVSGVEEVRNLYVNDYPASRARSKYLYVYEEEYKADGSGHKHDGVITSSVNFPKFSQPQYLETYWPIWWKLLMHPVEDIKYGEDGRATIIMDQPAWDFPYAGSAIPVPGESFYLVNAMELLDEPGEFYYNKDDGFIYYYPYKAEDMNTADTYVGKTEILFDIRGKSKENKLTNIVFDNLAFRYGAWDESSKLGYIPIQADCSGDVVTGNEQNDDGSSIIKSPGQIKINNTENLSITNCDFACIGSSALQITDSVKNVKFEGNLLRDINGAGMIIGATHHSTGDGRLAKTNTEPCQNFMIRNNVFTRVAYEYQNQTAIIVYYERNINVVNNDISHTGYTGVSSGWGFEGVDFRSVYHENIKLTHNRISHTMENLIDGGPFYTLGNLGCSEIAYNHISDCHYRNGGIYLDAGSSEASVHHNVIEDAYYWLFIQSGYAAKDDFLYDNYSTSSRWERSGDLNNTVYQEPYLLEKGKYPQEAIEIMQNAGVEDEYKHLLEKAKLPSWMKQVSLGAPRKAFISEVELAPKFGWIQAENFIPGEQGETYYDMQDHRGNNSYRYEGVALMKIAFDAGHYDEYSIHECFGGEWMTYKVRIPEDGEYTFKVNAAQGYEGEEGFNLYVDGECVLESANLLKGELGFVEMIVSSFEGIYMTAGEHIIKYEFADGGHYLDAIGFFSDKYPPDEEMDKTKNAPDYDEGVFEYEAEIPQFEDISGHYAEQDIIALRDANIIKGVDEKTFAPDAQLTKEQTAWLCMRAAEIPFNMNSWVDTAEDLGMISQSVEDASTKVNARFGWIQAENFIPGEQGEAYYDIQNKRNNNPYRNEGVGLLKTTFEAGDVDGYVIHECGDGEWVTYKARIPEDGEYTFKVNAAHGHEGEEGFSLYVDDECVIEDGKLLKGELGWNEMVVTSFEGIHMTAGEHIIKYEFKDDGHYLDAIGFFSDKFEEDADEPLFNKKDGMIEYDGGAEISREEFAHMIMCSYRSMYGAPDNLSEISFTDKDTISDEYYQGVLEACEVGLLIGDPDGSFRPKDGLTRAEASVAIRRLLEK